jgi:hypothetical protein
MGIICECVKETDQKSITHNLERNATRKQDYADDTSFISKSN